MKLSSAAPQIITAAAVLILNLAGVLVLTAAGVIDLPQQEVPQSAAADRPADPGEANPPLPAERAVVEAVTNWLPDSWKPSGAVERRAAELFGYSCGPWPLPASLTAKQPVSIPGLGVVTVTAFAVPAGYGAATVSDLGRFVEECPGRDSDPWVERSDVNRVAAVTLGLTSGDQTASQLLWNRSDLLLSITSAGNRDLTAVAKDWDRSVAAPLVATCPDLTEKVGDRRRSPWLHPDRYTGLVQREAVRVSEPKITVELVRRPRGLRHLPQTVERPEPPSQPHWPAGLPLERRKPLPPKRPAKPKFSETISYQVADPTGPGCGWQWLGQPQPRFTDVDSAARRNAAWQKANARLTRSAQRWQTEESNYRQALPAYYQRAAAWRQYAQDVDAVAEAWQETRDEWDRYYRAEQQYQWAVTRLAAWQRDTKAASAAYAAEVARCAGQAAPAPGTSPGTTPGTVTANCPPVMPAILMQPRPVVPPRPEQPRNPVPRMPTGIIQGGR